MIEIDIEPNLNIDDSEIRNFMGRKPSIPINKFHYYNEDSKEFTFINVVGWQDGRAIQAYGLEVEDSGDGQAFLIYGGNQGLRIGPSSRLSEDFSLDNKEEWGELYLYYAFSFFENHIKPFI